MYRQFRVLQSHKSIHECCLPSRGAHTIFHNTSCESSTSMPVALTLFNWLLGTLVPFDYFRLRQVINVEWGLRIDVWLNLVYEFFYDNFCCFVLGIEIAFPFAVCKENSMLPKWRFPTRMITVLDSFARHLHACWESPRFPTFLTMYYSYLWRHSFLIHVKKRVTETENNVLEMTEFLFQ